MTINEIEQGIRNLIATQPMVASGSNADVINGINSIIDAFRNFEFRVNTYPCQDVVKFGLANESAKLENAFVNLVVQALQERGINILLYIPRMDNKYGPMINNFGMISQSADPNMMMGQMMYRPNMVQPQDNMMIMQNNMPMPGQPMINNSFNQMQPQMYGVGQQPTQAFAPKAPAQSQTRVPSQEPKPVRQTVKKEVKKEEIVVNSTPKIQKRTQEASSIKKTGPSPAEALMGESQGGGESAKGRDYLLELLKK